MPKYASLVWDGEVLTVPEEMGKPQDHHLLSTPLDNLIELSGRVCYDSLKVKKSRSSPDYHKHIAEVGHGSVHEHANFNCLIPRWFYNHSVDKESSLLKSILNRPGVFFRETSEGFRITLNVRVVADWGKHNKYNNSEISDWLADQLKSIAVDLCPMAMFGIVKSKDQIIEKVKPEVEEEIWISFYLRSISRSNSHELVRHKFMTGVSQRSTRYVDEYESNWSWHPLIDLWEQSGGDISKFKDCEKTAKELYKSSVVNLEEFIKSRGADKFSARKQARGAARGVLGNALSTELIFSASLAQWKWILKLRASDFADAEIRIAMLDVFYILKERFPDNFKGWNLVKSSDGIGEVIAIEES